MERGGRVSAAGRWPGGYREALVTSLLILLIGAVVQTTALPADNLGREFVFAFPPNYPHDATPPSLGLVLRAVTAGITNVEVSVPRRNIIYNFALNFTTSPFKVAMPSDLTNAMVSGVTTSTVLVRADRDIAVMTYNAKDYTMDVFTVYPTAYMGTEYFIATFTQPSGGIIMVSAYDEPVEIQMTVNAQVSYRGVDYWKGGVIKEVLQPYQTMQLEPMDIDIVGSQILSNSSITVTVGCLCAYVPDGVNRCDHLAEQLIPFNRWGRNFLLNPLYNRLSGYQYQVIAGRNGTVVSLNTEEILLNMGDYYLADINNQVMTSIHSNHPIMVVQYSKGTDTDYRIGDPAMTIVPALEQYTSLVEFSAFDFTSNGISAAYLAVTAECNQTDAIQLDMTPYSQVNWLIRYDITQENKLYCTRWTAVEGGKHILGVVEGSGVSFSSLVYGIGRRVGYLYNPGFNLEKQTCTVPSVDTPDGVEEGPCHKLKPKSCPEEVTSSNYGPIIWRETPGSTQKISDELCPFDTLRVGSPLGTRMCLADSRGVASWGEPTLFDCGPRNADFLPADLAKIIVDKSNVGAVSGVLEEVTGNLDEVDDEIVGDVSQTLENIVAVEIPEPKVTTSVVNAVGNLMVPLANSSSQSEDLAASASSVVRSVERQISLTLRDGGAFSLSGDNVVVQASTLNDALLSEDGIEFDGEGDAGSPSIRLPLSALSSGDGGNALGRTTTMRPANIASATKVRFIMFKNDALFRAPNGTRTSGIVISAAVEGRSIENLEEPIEITFELDEEEAKGEVQCVYWDFQLRDGVGDWSTEGCVTGNVTGGNVTCACDHLTNFAVLMDISGQHNVEQTKFHFALDLLSTIGCAVSIVALVLTLIVFFAFRRLRSSRPRRILVHFCISLLGLYIVFLLGIDHAVGNRTACITVGVLLHFFMLSTVAWMGVEALNMYLLIIRVFDEEGRWFLTKACFMAWGLPALLVSVTLVLRKQDYLFKSYCFLSPSPSFYYGVLLPIALVLTFNLIMFIVIIRRLWTANLGGNVPLDDQDAKAARYRQLRVRLLNAFSISVLLGLTWAFGFFAIETATYAFQLIFCVVNSLQGLIVFVLFCARQDDVRKSLKPTCGRLRDWLPGQGRPNTITTYSLSRRNKGNDMSRTPLRTPPVSAATYSSKLSTTDASLHMTSSSHEDVSGVFRD